MEKIKLEYAVEYNTKNLNQIKFPPVVKVHCECGKDHLYKLSDAVEYDRMECIQIENLVTLFREYSVKMYGRDVFTEFEKFYIDHALKELKYEDDVKKEIDNIIKDFNL